MSKIEVHHIGRVEQDESGTRIVLDPAFGPALRGLEGYSHVQVVWWFCGRHRRQRAAGGLLGRLSRVFRRPRRLLLGGRVGAGLQVRRDASDPFSFP